MFIRKHHGAMEKDVRRGRQSTSPNGMDKYADSG